MEPNFNIDRPKVNDEEINLHKDFDQLVKQFKEKSLKQALGDESWWKNKKVRYSTIIAGITVICTISYLSLFRNQKQQNKNETIITSTTPTQNKKATRPLIDAPSRKLKIPYSTYKINNAKGGDITHSTSSKIKIPKNSFVSKEGKDIIGDVIIEYREFHDMGDIVASGIPMAYDSAGSHYNLESAGMFDIRGSQNGERVFIKPEKKIEVELASSNDEKRFNQYFLDTVSKNWNYIQKDKMNPVSSKAAKHSVSVSPPETTNQFSPKLLTLRNQIEVVIPKKVDSVKTFYAKRAEQLPRAREPLKPAQPTKGRPTFKLDGSYNEFPELAAFDNIVFEVGPENMNYTKDMHEITWSDVKITQGPVNGKNYILNLSYRNRSEKLIVYPVLTGVDFEKAQKSYEHKFSEYEALVEKRKATEQKLFAEMQAKQEAYMVDLKKKQKEYDLERAKILSKYQMQQQNEIANNFNTMSNSLRATRLFSVSQFGIFNSDCPHQTPVNKSVNPIFVLDNGEKYISPDYIYLVDHKTKSVYNLDARDSFTMNYNSGDEYSVCVFSRNRIFTCSKKDFQSAVVAGNNRFLIKALPLESENLVEFKKALEI